MPAQPISPTSAERLHCSFFRRESGGIAFVFVCLALCIGDFARCEHALHKSSAVGSENRSPNPAHFTQIDSCTDDHSPAPEVVIVRRPCLTPFAEMSASAMRRTAADLPLRTIPSRQLS